MYKRFWWTCKISVCYTQNYHIIELNWILKYNSTGFKDNLFTGYKDKPVTLFKNKEFIYFTSWREELSLYPPHDGLRHIGWVGFEPAITRMLVLISTFMLWVPNTCCNLYGPHKNIPDQNLHHIKQSGDCQFPFAKFVIMI